MSALPSKTGLIGHSGLLRRVLHGSLGPLCGEPLETPISSAASMAIDVLRFFGE